MGTHRKLYTEFNYLKFFMACFVVLLHGNFYYDVNEKISFLLVDGVFRIAVPVFFSLSGFFLYKNFTKFGFNFNKNKLILLYLFWMLFYSYFWVRAPDISLGNIISIVFFGYHHLWFLPALIISSLIMPHLLAIGKSRVIILSVSLYSIGVYLQYISNMGYLYFSSLESTFVYRNFLFFGLPFLTLGWFVSQNEEYIKNKIKHLSCVFLLSVSLLMLLMESKFVYHYIGSSSSLDLMLTLPIFVFSILAYCLSIKASNHQLAILLGKLSLGVYLIHPFVYKVIRKLFYLPESYESLLCLTISAFTTFIFILISRKIPITLSKVV
ncbi:acyltransferase family protein [Vibrio cyclitrophicus]